MLTQQKLLALLIYDPLTGKLYWQRRIVGLFTTHRAYATWNARYAGKEAFTATDHKGYRVGAVDNKNYRASRIIYFMVHGVLPDQVDHEDGDRQNNRITNLRDVSGLENQRNMKKPINNTSGVVGVSWNVEKQKWDARIGHTSKYLGRFDTFDEAVACRKQAEADHGYHKNHGR